MKMDKIAKRKIVERLNEKRANHPCPSCGHKKFSLLDGFVNINLNNEVSSGLVIGGPQVPCVVVACDNCGNLTYHAIGALGLLNENNGDV